MANKKSTAWMEDGDDAHFVSAKKHRGKNRLVGAGTKANGHPRVAYRKGPLTRKSGNGKTTRGRKRVAGK